MADLTSSRSAASTFRTGTWVWLLALMGYLAWDRWERGRAVEVLLGRELRIVDDAGRTRLMTRNEGDEVQLVVLAGEALSG